jgi:ribosomal protein S18 acetylase RimI-like enzyme
MVGTARALSDGVSNAYVVDVWTKSGLRRRGIARNMLAALESRLSGQHVYLFSDDMADVYRACGYRERPVGLEKVVGTWLQS